MEQPVRELAGALVLRVTQQLGRLTTLDDRPALERELLDQSQDVAEG